MAMLIAAVGVAKFHRSLPKEESRCQAISCSGRRFRRLTLKETDRFRLDNNTPTFHFRKTSVSIPSQRELGESEALLRNQAIALYLFLVKRPFQDRTNCRLTQPISTNSLARKSRYDVHDTRGASRRMGQEIRRNLPDSQLWSKPFKTRGTADWNRSLYWPRLAVPSSLCPPGGPSAVFGLNSNMGLIDFPTSGNMNAGPYLGV